MAFGIDPNVLNSLRTMEDYRRAEQEFSLNNQVVRQKLMQAQNGADLPAPLQLANEYQRRIQMGDIQGANTLAAFAKTVDKGLQQGADGNYYVAQGYAPAVGELAQAKGYGTQLGKDTVQMQTAPIIARGKADATNASALEYKPGIAFETALKGEEAKRQGEFGKKQVQAGNMMDLISEAETILPQASSGTAQAAQAGVQGFFGQSTPATKANARLGVIGAGLVSNIPRMEGPQSDRDVAMYREAAGNVANANIPTQDRLAALQTIKALQQKYIVPASLDDVLAAEQPALGDVAPVQSTQSVGTSIAAKPKMGQVVNGYVFKGGNPNDKKNWEKWK